MDEERCAILLHTSWQTLFMGLPKEQAGELIQAVCSYNCGIPYEITNPAVSAMFVMMCEKMDEDHANYAETRRKRSEWAKKAADARWGNADSMRAHASASEGIRPNAENALTNSNSNSNYMSSKEDKNKYRGAKRKVFSPPSVEDVEAYCRERGNSVNAEQFVDYYTANGWKVGKNPMKDWKAAVRTWERNKSPNVVKMSTAQQHFKDMNDELDRIIRGEA